MEKKFVKRFTHKYSVDLVSAFIYRPGYSSKTTLMHITAIALYIQAIDNSQCTVLIILDFSKASDPGQQHTAVFQGSFRLLMKFPLAQIIFKLF